MGGGKDKHDKSDKGLISHLAHVLGAPPHGSHHPPRGYPPQGYPPQQGYGHGMNAILVGGAAAYGAHHVGHGCGCHFAHGAHGFEQHGKCKHHGGKFKHGKHGKHGKFGKHHGGKFKK